TISTTWATVTASPTAKSSRPFARSPAPTSRFSSPTAGQATPQSASHPATRPAKSWGGNQNAPTSLPSSATPGSSTAPATASPRLTTSTDRAKIGQSLCPYPIHGGFDVEPRFQLQERLPTVAEFQHLRAGAGWHVPDDETAAAALSGCITGVVAVTAE